MKPMGGTELMEARINDLLGPDTLAGVRIVHGAPDVALNPDDINIFVAHDLPTDKGIDQYQRDTKFSAYDAIVCVSHWQRNLFMYTGFPTEKLHVIENFVEPMDVPEFVGLPVDHRPLKFIYTPTPHRGLQELVAAFVKVYELYPYISLDIYSSFALYGQPEKDVYFESTFKIANEHPAITNHGTVSNLEIREALSRSDCFVYPSKWPETSCLCLIEAMTAGIDCIHTDLAALPETSGGLSYKIPVLHGAYDPNTIPDLVYATTDAMLAYIKDVTGPYGQTRSNAPIQMQRALYLFSPERARENWTTLIDTLKGIRYGEKGDSQSP